MPAATVRRQGRFANRLRQPARSVPWIWMACLACFAVACGGAENSDDKGTRESTDRGSDSRPNIVVIFADQYSPRYVGSQGHPGVRTPNLDRLAREGVRFANAYCNAPICSPSRAALHFGKYPPETGVVQNNVPVTGDVTPLAVSLAEAGYATFASGKTHLSPAEVSGGAFQGTYELNSGVLSTKFQPEYLAMLERELQRNPTRFGSSRIPAWEQSLTEINSRFRYSPELMRGPSPIPEPLYPATLITDHALEFIDRAAADARPFFLFASYFIPHNPYFPPEPYDAMTSPDEVVLTSLHGRTALDGRRPKFEIPPEEWRRIIAAYRGLVTLFDKQVGRLLAGLERAGVAGDTLVVFTADHGDMLGEFGILFKDRIEEASARIPMIVRFPEGLTRPEAARRGLEVTTPVSMVDVHATVFDAARIRRPESAGLRGESLARRLDDPHAERRIHCVDQRTSGLLKLMIRDRRHKLTLRGNRFQLDGLEPYLVDLVEDPGETRNLAFDGSLAGIRGSLESDLRAWWDEQVSLEPAEVAELFDFEGRRDLTPKERRRQRLERQHRGGESDGESGGDDSGGKGADDGENRDRDGSK